MTNANSLQLVNEGTWFSGFTNMWHKESKRWWGSRFGLWQIAIWFFIINGINSMILIAEPSAAVAALIPLASMFSLIGAVILAQGAIIGEKQLGTAAWVLSAPVSRNAFLISKWLTLILGCLATMIVLPYAIAYLEFSLVPDIIVPVTSFLTATGISALHLAFYLCLTLMLGTLFNSRGPVMGIPLAVFFGGMILIGATVTVDGVTRSLLPPWLLNLTPWPLTDTAVALVQTQSMVSLVPIIATAWWSIIFVLLALWRFQREEF